MALFHRWQASWSPHAPAITAGGATRTYGDLAGGVARAVGWLQAEGVRPGDVVALMMPREAVFVDLVLACFSMGAVAFPMNDRYPAPEAGYLLQDAAPVLAILPAAIGQAVGAQLHWVGAGGVADRLAVAEQARMPEPPANDAPALLMYTSGTTGRPKGALHTHRTLGAAVEALHEGFRWQADDVLLHVLPQYHVHGLVVAQLGAIRAGAHARWLPGFEASAVSAALDRASGSDVTVFMGVPTHYQRLLVHDGGHDFSGVRLFTSGSAPLPAPVWQGFLDRFGHAVLERYGMTEIGIVMANPYEDRRAGAIGMPLRAVEARIAEPGADRALDPNEVGELQIRGPSVFVGYRGRPDATAAAVVGGWMQTGDLGFRDEDGYYRLVGRRSDMVISGGFNVYPAEVEAVLLEHPVVRECAVFGLPDADLGEIVAVAWVPTEGTGDTPDLRGFLEERVAAYKIPRMVHRLDGLPRNAMGKILKRELREHFETQRPKGS